MNKDRGTLFEAFLNQHDQKAWEQIIATLLPSIHEVDRTATEIWFAFFPRARAWQQAAEPVELAATLQLRGKYLLKDQIDSSHQFLYGHRCWPDVKNAVIEYAASATAPSSLDLADQVRGITGRVAATINVDPSLLVGITAVALMTVQQVGMSAFEASPGFVTIPPGAAHKSPAQVLKTRAQDDSQGLFGFLKGDRKDWTVTFNEQDEAARFKLIHTQHLTTAAANDKRDYHSRDPRCTAGEGPIPVQCRTASCGTCWVGVLGGAEKLSSVEGLERRKIKEFGYIDTDEPKPIIRLACMAQAYGAVSIVIPPWNGVFGRVLESEQSWDGTSTKRA